MKSCLFIYGKTHSLFICVHTCVRKCLRECEGKTARQTKKENTGDAANVVTECAICVRDAVCVCACQLRVCWAARSTDRPVTIATVPHLGPSVPSCKYESHIKI